MKVSSLLRLIVLLPLAWLAAAAPGSSTPVVDVIVVTGPIGPASADFVLRGIERAEHNDAALVVLQIDTPGGLDTSMRDIIKGILAARVPVAAFVAPGGARAASAGTYILYASPVAAMAPGTNLGAATPVAIGGAGALPMPGTTEPQPADKGKATSDGVKPADSGKSGDTMAKKEIHDAAAYMRGLAQLHGRNADWAERAVREAVSLSAQEALAQHVIDLVAADVPDLAAKLEGRKVKTAAGERVLRTAGATINLTAPDWRTNFLAIITHPSIALILLMVGFYGLVFEVMNPGLVLPGVVGAIALLIGMYALQMLPTNYAGLALILVGLGFIVAEAFVPAYGSLGIGGIIAFAVGSTLLIDTDIPGFGVPGSLIALLAIVSALFLFGIAAAALKARHRPVVSGREQMIGSTGIVVSDVQTEVWARVHGELWQVRSAQPLHEGQLVRVTAKDGMMLSVVAVQRER